MTAPFIPLSTPSLMGDLDPKTRAEIERSWVNGMGRLFKDAPANPTRPAVKGEEVEVRCIL